MRISGKLPLISLHPKCVYGLYRDIFGIRQPRCYVIYFRDGGSVVSAIENPSIYIGKFRSKRVAKHGETLKADRRMQVWGEDLLIGLTSGIEIDGAIYLLVYVFNSVESS
jgi:hypothetical protein